MYNGAMNRADVIARLKTVEPALRKRGVAALYLFGSHARDEAQAGSDVDVFVDPADESDFGLMSFMDTLAMLERAFPETEIGYSTREGIVPAYLPLIEASAVRVF